MAKLCLEANNFIVIDRREQPQYWVKDIDFTVSKNGFTADIEIKWDAKINDSGAMFFELLTNIQENQLGWANYTQADYIWYGYAKSQIFYIFKVDDMRQFLKEFKGEYETKVANDYNSRDGSIKK